MTEAVHPGLGRKGADQRSPLAGLAALAAITVYGAGFLMAESELVVIGLLLLAAAVVLVAGRFGLVARVRASFAANEPVMHAAIVVAVLALCVLFREDHFTLLLVATVLLYTLACVGLNVQFGYAGLVNFSGAAFFGVGGYTAAVLSLHTGIPSLLILAIGGLMAALVGCLLVLPVLRTRGHYMAVITIAFSLLFKTFIEVNDALGGPQGLAVGSFRLLGWDFNSNLAPSESIEFSFYTNYVLAALVLCALAFALARRLERSWIGLNMDVVRLDETAAACFGLNPARWRALAFTLGNFIAGVAGALFAMMLGFIAPNNFTFGDSLILVSIVLLGGMGSQWGVAVAAAIIVLLPEKLQIIQEYRFLLFAATVILILLFRPQGLLPRQPRSYFPGRPFGGGEG